MSSKENENTRGQLEIRETVSSDAKIPNANSKMKLHSRVNRTLGVVRIIKMVERTTMVMNVPYNVNLTGKVLN